MNTERDDGVIVALDIGGTGVSGGLVEATGAIRVVETAATDRLRRGDGIRQSVLDIVARLEDHAKALDTPILGVGVGVPGVVEPSVGRIGPDIQNLPELTNLPLRALLEERTGRRVAVDNDVNALVLAEWMFGHAKSLRHVAMLAAGTGVGGGLIVNGALLRGAAGYAGEIGHITVELDGRPCFCGSRGCVKAYASGPDIAAQAREMLGGSASAVFAQLTGGDLARIDAPVVFRAADRGDAVAETVVAKAAQALGAAVATLINLCNPEMIVLGGGVMDAGDILVEPVRRWARRYAFERAVKGTRIVRSSFTKESGILGAAALFLYEMGSA